MRISLEFQCLFRECIIETVANTCIDSLSLSIVRGLLLELCKKFLLTFICSNGIFPVLFVDEYRDSSLRQKMVF